MFIRPLDTATLSSATWQNHAGNSHFTLQSKKRDGIHGLTEAVLKFFKNISQNLTISSDQHHDAYKKSIAEFDFRIILKIATRNKQFVVSVDDSFDKIHTDWNWVERNLFLKV
jgi:tRNA U34 2-thiouridine synthase MnmA/TrmU